MGLFDSFKKSLAVRKEERLNDQLLAAAEAGETERVRALLERGADIESVERCRKTALHLAVERGHVAIVRLLLERGAEVDVFDAFVQTPLHRAAGHGYKSSASKVVNVYADIVSALLQHGAEVHAKEKEGNTPLQKAAEIGDKEAVRILLDHGADVDDKNKYRRTALHFAAGMGHTDVVRLLLDRGADMAARSGGGYTAFHDAAEYHHLDTVNLLLDRGADIKQKTTNGSSPLALAIRNFGADLTARYDTLRKLCQVGAPWDESCNLNHRNAMGWEVVTTTGFRACVRHWTRQRARNPSTKLTDVAIEDIKGGKQSVETYLNAIQNTADDEIVRRRKLCVVGASCSGKTSFVKSLQELKTVMVEEEDRTIGIDLFGLDWKAVNESGKYEATIWDFAGQDIYQVAHSLYFSKRTLYLVFVNAEMYSEQLVLADDGIKQSEARMNRWARDNIFSWVQLILGRQPDAELVIVCSKCDKVGDTTTDSVISDLEQRLAVWASDFVNDHDGPMRQEIQKSVEEFTERGRLRVSIVKQETVEMALQDVQRVVAEKPMRAYLMPKLYTQVLEAVYDLQEAAGAATSEAERVEGLLMQSDELVRDLMDRIDGLERRQCRDILGTLHALGDILWFEQERHLSSAGSSTIVLDPRIMLDLVREVVNHEFGGRHGAEYDALRTHGVLKHSLLSTFPLWRVLCEESPQWVLYFKRLLKHFNLAYPVGKQALVWDCDLIVPCYWKMKRQPAGAAMGGGGVVGESFSNESVWQYTVPANVSETIFDQFIVRSYDANYERVVAPTGVVMAKPKLCSASIMYKEGKKPTEDVVLISVTAASVDECWRTLEFLVVSMEHVLGGYPGLGTVRRHVLKKGGRKTAEYDVMRLIKNEVCDAASMVEKVKALMCRTSVGA